MILNKDLKQKKTDINTLSSSIIRSETEKELQIAEQKEILKDFKGVMISVLYHESHELNVQKIKGSF